MHSCLKISMGFLAGTFAHKIHLVILPFSYTFVLATKQTLLSILLANHALFETYFQDEGSQMNTQSKLEDLW